MLFFVLFNFVVDAVILPKQKFVLPYMVKKWRRGRKRVTKWQQSKVVCKPLKLRSCSDDHPKKCGNSTIERRNFWIWTKNIIQIYATVWNVGNAELKIASHLQRETDRKTVESMTKWWWCWFWANKMKRGMKTAAAPTTKKWIRESFFTHYVMSVCLYVCVDGCELVVFFFTMRIKVLKANNNAGKKTDSHQFRQCCHEPREQSNIMSNFATERSFARLSSLPRSPSCFSSFFQRLMKYNANFNPSIHLWLANSPQNHSRGSQHCVCAQCAFSSIEMLTSKCIASFRNLLSWHNTCGHFSWRRKKFENQIEIPLLAGWI